MALVLPNSIFFHVGRTAGHCVRKTIREMGIPTYDVGRFHDWPSNIALNEEERKKLFFCFVRHPLAWLRSFWCHQMQFGWSESDYNAKTQSDSFAEFLTKALAAYPAGPASEAFRPFLLQCQEVGRQEHLTEDLRRIFERAGERIDTAVLDRIRPTGVEIDSEIREAATAPQALLETVLEAERDLCEQFGYADIPAGMMGPANVCLSAYVPLGESKQPFTTDGLANDSQPVMNSFVLNGERIAGARHPCRQSTAMLRVLRQLDYLGKAVVEIGYDDGVFSFFAESLGATRVVGINSRVNDLTERLREALASDVEFLQRGYYGVEQSIDGDFDIVICQRRLHEARHPLLLIRTLSRLLKEGGTLVLATHFVDVMPGVPVLYMPVGSEAPISSRGCTCFNKEGLLNALAIYGFQDVVIHSTLETVVDPRREFSQMPFGESDVRHDSESLLAYITLTCTLNSTKADRDSRYVLDEAARQEIVDSWEVQFPKSRLPEHQATQTMLVRYAEMTSRHAETAWRAMAESRQLKDQLATATAAIHDRERELIDTRRLLEERTALLEQLHADIAARTADLVETRQLLVERTVRLEQAIAGLQPGGVAIRPKPLD